MTYFMETSDSIATGLGFSHYDGTHIFWLLIFAASVVLNAILYKKLSGKGKGIWRKTVAILLVLDEIFKVVMLVIGGRYTPGYLPLHLCSINIFVIAFHAWKPTKFIESYLYGVAIPATFFALAFPTWTKLPLLNFMHIHSFTVHILLMLYPLVLLICGDIRPKIKDIPKCLLTVIGLAVPAFIANLIFDTNFMFLSSASKGNPLYWFEQNWGDHRYGFPVILVAVWIVMYLPVFITERIKKRKQKTDSISKAM